MRQLLAHLRLCRAVEAYFDGELPPGADAEVSRHLSACWECSSRAETLRLVKHALRHGAGGSPRWLAERRLRRFAHGLTREGLPG
ncbi:MAG TPA: hypothetical protein VF942_18150 [Acidimicrobiales bacterium]